MKNNRNTLVEFIPSLIFVAAYKMWNLNMAIKLLIVSTLIGVIYQIYRNKKLPWILIFSFSILAIFGGLSLYSGDSFYIKIKPTVIYTAFALVLFSDSIFNLGIVEKMARYFANFSHRSIKSLARHSAYFFLFLAMLNEFIWRNYSEESWVMIKSFGFPILNTAFFSGYILYLMNKENIKLN